MSEMEEYLDIVDINDIVIGRDTRKNVHDNYQIHRGVHVFVVNSLGEILLQKRSMEVTDYKGYWDSSVGCQVRSGETYLQAAERETPEELSFNPTDLEEICKYNAYSTRQKEKRTLYICHND